LPKLAATPTRRITVALLTRHEKEQLSKCKGTGKAKCKKCPKFTTCRIPEKLQRIQKSKRQGG